MLHLSGMLWRWPRTEIYVWYQNACWGLHQSGWGDKYLQDASFTMGKLWSETTWRTDISIQNSIEFLSKLSQRENVCLQKGKHVGRVVLRISAEMRKVYENVKLKLFAFLWIPLYLLCFIYSAMKGSHDVHILHLNQTWQVAQAIKSNLSLLKGDFGIVFFFSC